MSQSTPEIIYYGYELAPNPQKLVHFLAFYGIPYKYVEIPVIMPRPMLAEIGITYRRTPLLSIGSDMYIDTALIISKLAEMARHSNIGPSDTANHLEYDSLGQDAVQLAVGIMPSETPMLHDQAFLDDRSELVGFTFNPEFMLQARPATVSKLLSLLHVVQHDFLGDGERKFFLGGTTPTTADLYLFWALNWGLSYIQGGRPEISESTHPKVFEWVAAVEAFLKDRKHQTEITIEDAYKVLQMPSANGKATDVPHVEKNPEGLSLGQRIKVTPTDTGKSGPQFGKLLALNYAEVCLENDKGLVMHFPRLGYETVAA